MNCLPLITSLVFSLCNNSPCNWSPSLPDELSPVVDSVVVQQLLADDSKPLEKWYPRLSVAGKVGFIELCELALSHDRMLTVDEAAAVLHDQSDEFSWRDYGVAFHLFALSQESSKQRADLQQAMKRREEAVRSVSLSYYTGTLQAKGRIRGQMNRRFIRQEECIFFERQLMGAPGIVNDFERASFDGAVTRYVRWFGDASPRIPDSPDTSINAAISEGFDAKHFDDQANPLCLLKMLPFGNMLESDERRDWEQSLLEDSNVFEQPVEVGGHECLVVGTSTRWYYFCPQMGYALIGYDRSDQALRPETLVIPFEGTPYHQQRGKGWREVDEGVWFPQEIVSRHNGGGGLKWTNRSFVESVDFSPETEASEFQATIPPNVYVKDFRKSEMYLSTPSLHP